MTLSITNNLYHAEPGDIITYQIVNTDYETRNVYRTPVLSVTDTEIVTNPAGEPFHFSRRTGYLKGDNMQGRWLVSLLPPAD